MMRLGFLEGFETNPEANMPPLVNNKSYNYRGKR